MPIIIVLYYNYYYMQGISAEVLHITKTCTITITEESLPITITITLVLRLSITITITLYQVIFTITINYYILLLPHVWLQYIASNNIDNITIIILCKV